VKVELVKFSWGIERLRFYTDESLRFLGVSMSFE
jgi:hypothetical protein